MVTKQLPLGVGCNTVKTKKAAKYIKHLTTHAKVKIGNDYIHDQIGFNYKMTNLSAAVGCALRKYQKIIMLKEKILTITQKFLRDIKK